jgi:hypothetical protein
MVVAAMSCTASDWFSHNSQRSLTSVTYMPACLAEAANFATSVRSMKVREEQAQIVIFIISKFQYSIFNSQP